MCGREPSISAKLAAISSDNGPSWSPCCLENNRATTRCNGSLRWRSLKNAEVKYRDFDIFLVFKIVCASQFNCNS